MAVKYKEQFTTSDKEAKSLQSELSELKSEHEKCENEKKELEV